MARRFLYLIVLIIILIIAAFTFYRLYSGTIYRAAFIPSMEFKAPEIAPENTYAGFDMWFSHPKITPEKDPALWVAKGYQLPETPKAAVFFIHPTSYLGRDYWNAPLSDKDSQDRAALFIRGEASVFNGVAEIWAPRYRQATFGAFLTDSPEATQALEAAYRDVETAFDQFIADIPADRPIILAGHSQGALHLTHLLKDRIAGTELAERIVAAYVVGWPVSIESDLPQMGLAACESADQAGCILSWMSFAEPADASLLLGIWDRTIGYNGAPRKGNRILCTNPLNGQMDGAAAMDQNFGTLVPAKNFLTGTLLPKSVPARCDGRGLLLIGDPPKLGPGVLPGNNYHVYDYPLFWANLRVDARKRLAAFLGEQYLPEEIGNDSELDKDLVKDSDNVSGAKAAADKVG